MPAGDTQPLRRGQHQKGTGAPGGESFQGGESWREGGTGQGGGQNVGPRGGEDGGSFMVGGPTWVSLALHLFKLGCRAEQILCCWQWTP